MVWLQCGLKIILLLQFQIDKPFLDLPGHHVSGLAPGRQKAKKYSMGIVFIEESNVFFLLVMVYMSDFYLHL